MSAPVALLRRAQVGLIVGCGESMKVTAEDVKRWTGWPNITEHVRKGSHRILLWKWDYKYLEIRINPDNPDYFPIEILFDSSGGLIHVAFASWHDHFDHLGDPADEIAAAMNSIRDLVSGNSYLLESLDANGVPIKCRMIESSSSFSETASIHMRTKAIGRTRMVSFNTEPTEQPSTQQDPREAVDTTHASQG